MYHKDLLITVSSSNESGSYTISRSWKWCMWGEGSIAEYISMIIGAIPGEFDILSITVDRIEVNV